MICPARDLIALVEADPFADDALPKADKHLISVVEKHLGDAAGRHPVLPAVNEQAVNHEPR